MAKKLTILFAPVDAYGHFNACIGLAEPLRDRGHNVIFATPNGWKGKLAELGFGEEWYSTESMNDDEASSPNTPAAQATEIVQGLAESLAMSPKDQIKSIMVATFPIGFQRMMVNSEPSFKRILAKIKPDVIVVDTLFTPPALVTSGIPWILSCSCNPLMISKENVPPAFSGLPTDGNADDFQRFELQLQSELKEIFDSHNSWVISNGGEPLHKNHPAFINHSPYANIYMFPSELDYTDFRPNPPNWHHFETFIRSSKEHFEIPKELDNLPGRLIYFSMGSIGCSEVSLMKKLIAIFGKSPNRFIVAKGPLGDKYELPSNMWGAKMLPQTKVLPLVDLVITHGGNNTVTESFYFGKPCIVLPLFCDQHDNGQRIHELGLGIHFRPYEVTEDELLLAIQKILDDDELAVKMENISKKMQSANSQSKAADLIEAVARQNTKS